MRSQSVCAAVLDSGVTGSDGRLQGVAVGAVAQLLRAVKSSESPLNLRVVPE